MMVAFNFKQQFSRDVELGNKVQTIRRKARCKPGDRLQLYTGMRTKQCRKLADAICTTVRTVHIDSDTLLIDGCGVYGWHRTCRARDDGFDSFDAFVGFFRKQYGLPFRGNIVSWRLDKEE